MAYEPSVSLNKAGNYTLNSERGMLFTCLQKRYLYFGLRQPFPVAANDRFSLGSSMKHVKILVKHVQILVVTIAAFGWISFEGSYCWWKKSWALAASFTGCTRIIWFVGDAYWPSSSIEWVETLPIRTSLKDLNRCIDSFMRFFVF